MVIMQLTYCGHVVNHRGAARVYRNTDTNRYSFALFNSPVVVTLLHCIMLHLSYSSSFQIATGRRAHMQRGLGFGCKHAKGFRVWVSICNGI